MAARVAENTSRQGWKSWSSTAIRTVCKPPSRQIQMPLHRNTEIAPRPSQTRQSTEAWIDATDQSVKHLVISRSVLARGLRRKGRYSSFHHKHRRLRPCHPSGRHPSDVLPGAFYEVPFGKLPYRSRLFGKRRRPSGRHLFFGKRPCHSRPSGRHLVTAALLTGLSQPPFWQALSDKHRHLFGRRRTFEPLCPRVVEREAQMRSPIEHWRTKVRWRRLPLARNIAV